MSKQNRVQFNLEGVKKGIDIVHDAVVSTIGGSGKNVMYRDYSGNPVVTNDGFTIAEMIHLEDESEKMGADFIKQASERQNYEAGDGTTTVISLAHAMIEGGLKKVKAGKNPMTLRREMEAAATKVIDKLKKSSKKITSDKELFDVANISMENPEMAKIVVTAVNTAGEFGRVVVQESTGVNTKVEEVKGIELKGGYLSPYMINNPSNLTSFLEDAPVLVADKSFGTLKDLFPVLEGLKAKGTDRLLVICRDVVGEALGNLILNIQKGLFFTVVVRIPDDYNVLEDIATLTGAQIVNEVNTPNELVPMHVNYLGKANRIVVSREKTLIDSGYGNKKEVEDRINAIKNEIKEADGEKKESLKDRLAKMAGKVVYVKVGAPTQQEMKYIKLKTDDAVASAVAAKKSGVVVGGGRALYDISLEKSKSDGEDVVFRACAFPMRRIIENAKRDPNEIIESLKSGEAWNSVTEKAVSDCVKEGLIDPVDIEVWAIRNAVSTAGMFLTTAAAIIPNEEKKLSTTQ